jgi:hypothetical protein
VILLRLLAALALLTWITCHAGLLVGLLLKRRWLHACVSMVLPPFAVHWGWNMKRRARVWLASLATYAVVLTVLRLAE